MIPYVSATRATTERTAPIGSSGMCPGALDSGMIARLARMPAATTGTLTRKIDGHAKCSSKSPASSGPATIPRAMVPLQIAMALGRSVSSKMSAMIESVGGMAREAPRPMNDRSAMSCSALPTSGVSADPSPKRLIPVTSSRRRPKRSERAPDISSRLAKTSVYASTIHWSWLVSASRWFERTGRATIRTVLSIEMPKRASARTARISHRRGCPWCGVVI